MLGAAAVMAGCGGAQPQGVGTGATVSPTADKVISTIPAQAPDWIAKEPAEKDGFLYFVGLSDKQATQQGARDSAEKNARGRVVAYLGSAFSEKLQKLTLSAGLSSDVVDASVARRGFEEHMTAGVASKVRAAEWYIERWARPSGEEYWLVYGLANVPVKAIDEAYASMMAGEAAKAKANMEAAKDAKMKTQFQAAMNMFESAKTSGFGLGGEAAPAPAPAAAPAPAPGGTTPVPAQ
jgi:hypothetical protein